MEKPWVFTCFHGFSSFCDILENRLGQWWGCKNCNNLHFKRQKIIKHTKNHSKYLQTCPNPYLFSCGYNYNNMMNTLLSTPPLPSRRRPLKGKVTPSVSNTHSLVLSNFPVFSSYLEGRPLEVGVGRGRLVLGLYHPKPSKTWFWYLKTRFFGGENLCFSIGLAGAPGKAFLYKGSRNLVGCRIVLSGLE